MHPLKVYNSEVFDIFLRCATITTIKFQNICIIPNRNSRPMCWPGISCD